MDGGWSVGWLCGGCMNVVELDMVEVDVDLDVDMDWDQTV